MNEIKEYNDLSINKYGIIGLNLNLLYYKITKFSILPLNFKKISYIMFLERECYSS